MNKNRLLLLTILLPMISFAQTTITGKIIDQVSKKPLSFASIAVQNSSTGTMSNDAGNFELNLKKGQTEIQISYIGYIDTLIIVNADISDYRISLKPYEYELAQVIVKSLSPLEYIKKALAVHPTLIPSEAFETRGFFATKSSVVNAENDAYKLEEAVFKTYNSDFANDTLVEASQLLLYRQETKSGFNSILEQNRRFGKMIEKAKESEEEEKANADNEDAFEDNEDEDDQGPVTVNINDLTSSGPESTIKEAKTLTSLDFFDEEYFDKYKYTFGEQTFFQGRELIKINFSNKRKVEGKFYSGSIYLDYQDLAIVAVDYNERYKVPFLVNALIKTIVGFTLNTIDRDVKVRNQFIYGKWYPKEVVYDLRVKIKQKKLYETISTAQLLNIEEIIIDNPNPIQEEFIFDKEVEYSEQIHPIDGVTWDAVNVINFNN